MDPAAVAFDDVIEAARLRSRTLLHTTVNPASPTIVNSVAETTIATFPLRADLAAGDLVRALILGDMLNNTGGAVTCTFRVNLGATTLLTSNAGSYTQSAGRRQLSIETLLLVVTPASAQHVGVRLSASAPNTANFPCGTPVTGVGQVAGAVDLTTGPSLVLTAQYGTADLLIDMRIQATSLELARR